MTPVPGPANSRLGLHLQKEKQRKKPGCHLVARATAAAQVRVRRAQGTGGRPLQVSWAPGGICSYSVNTCALQIKSKAWIRPKEAIHLGCRRQSEDFFSCPLTSLTFVPHPGIL